MEREPELCNTALDNSLSRLSFWTFAFSNAFVALSVPASFLDSIQSTRLRSIPDSAMVAAFREAIAFTNLKLLPVHVSVGDGTNEGVLAPNRTLVLEELAREGPA